MSRTIDDYDSMARREIIKAKQEKATTYVYSLGKGKPARQQLTRNLGECKSLRATMPNFEKSLSGSRRRWDQSPSPASIHQSCIHSSAPPQSVPNSSPRAPARLSRLTLPADASLHPLPPLLHIWTAGRRQTRQRIPSAAGCWARAGSSTRFTSTLSCRAPRRAWTTFSPRAVKYSTISSTSATCSRAPSAGYGMPPPRLDSAGTSLVGSIEEGARSLLFPVLRC